MECVSCGDRTCIMDCSSCSKEGFNKAETIEMYKARTESNIVNAAALLVDNGMAGTLGRIDEIIAFSKTMGYSKIGLAYCYGMSQQAKAVSTIFETAGLKTASVSCSVGGLMQSEVNANSLIHKVSCNPIGQALQLNTEKVDLTVIMGICLGHDILLQRHLNMDFTTLVVKDRLHRHNPLNAIK